MSLLFRAAGLAAATFAAVLGTPSLAWEFDTPTLLTPELGIAAPHQGVQPLPAQPPADPAPAAAPPPRGVPPPPPPPPQPGPPPPPQGIPPPPAPPPRRSGARRCPHPA